MPVVPLWGAPIVRRAPSPPTVPHAAWGAPTIVTHPTGTCAAPACILSRAPWSGENLYSGGMARCAPAPHFDAIVAEAERIGWPLQYRRDLYVHDRALLAQLDPSVPFLWIIREGGTHLYGATFTDDRPGRDASHFAKSVASTFAEPCHFYTWDGRRLWEHATPDDAAEAMAELKRALFRRDDSARS
jgi:hypothetical protein